MRSVDLVGIQMELSSGAPVVILREHDAPHRFLPIFVGGAEAASIAAAATGVTPSRPLTHDLTAALVRDLGGHLDAVEVSGLEDGTFLATLTLSGAGGELRVDTRPSDAIALAVRLRAPLFVSDDVLDVAGALPADPDEPDHDDVDPRDDPAIDPERIDAEVDSFRELLGELDADTIWSSLTDDLSTPPTPDVRDGVERGDEEPGDEEPGDERDGGPDA